MYERLLRALAVLALLLTAACGGGQGATQAPAPTAAATAAPTQPPPATAVALAPSPTVPQATATLGPDMFVNPVLNQDFPDPDALKVGDSYYAYATGNTAATTSVQVARSEDLVHWEVLPDAMPTFPPWVEPDHGLVWAPEVTTAPDGAGYLLYFTARVATSSRQCIGVATSAQPGGPFETAATEPLICQTEQGGSIDASSFVDEDGTRYLLWKNDGNCCGGETYIYIQRTSADGLTLEGEPAQLIHSDQRWEGPLVEAPTLWKHAGRYYLFYSANEYNTPRYAIGYAVADAPLGPYQKSEAPLAESDLPNAVVGPGGQDIVLDEDGETWMLYHSWGPGYRALNLNRLEWEGDRPVLQGPSGKLPQPIP
jgi:arabinan endo-1,5-alpha-L-arabinosidase